MPTGWPPVLTLECDAASHFGEDNADFITMVGRINRAGTIKTVEFIPGWTNAGANTNFRTLSLVNRGSAGAGNVTIATLALVSGTDLTKFTTKAITVTAANAIVAIGDVLEWVSVASGTGAPDVGGRVIVQQTAG